MLRRWMLGAIVCFVGLSCKSESEFNCQDDGDCGQQGQCEATGFCSFPDETCESGRRYGELAGTGLANACVNETGDTDTDPTLASSTASTTGLPDSGTTVVETGESASDESTGADMPQAEYCTPLPPPGGDEVVVPIVPADVDTLQAQIDQAAEGTTFTFADGVYEVPDGVRVRTAGVTLRSESGDPDGVVFQNSLGNAAVIRIEASNVTVAELTAQQGGSYNVFVTSNVPEPVENTTLYRLVLRDPGNYAVRINHNAAPADHGVLACSVVEMTDAYRNSTDSCDIIGGLSGLGTSGWDIRDNVFEGFFCPEGTGEPAITFASTSFDNIVQRNVLRECAVGIRFGNHEMTTPVREPPEHDCEEGYYGHFGGAILNNMVTANGTGIAASGLGFDSGILTWQVCGTLVAHNTVVSTQEHNSIEFRYDRTQVSVVNNLVTGAIEVRDDAGAPVAGNIEGATLGSFVSPLEDDVHLAPGSPAIDAGVPLGELAPETDIDGDARGDGAVDVGADEYRP